MYMKCIMNWGFILANDSKYKLLKIKEIRTKRINNETIAVFRNMQCALQTSQPQNLNHVKKYQNRGENKSIKKSNAQISFVAYKELKSNSKHFLNKH